MTLRVHVQQVKVFLGRGYPPIRDLFQRQLGRFVVEASKRFPKIEYGRGSNSELLSTCIKVTELSYGDKIDLETKTKRDLQACSCKSVWFTVEDSQGRVDDENHLKVADDEGKIVTTEVVVRDTFLSRAQHPIIVNIKCLFG